MHDKIQNPDVHGFFDKATGTITYVIHKGKESPCAIIDSVLDFNPHSGRTGTSSAEQVISYVKDNNLKLEWILETHAHADHISAASFLKRSLGGKTAIGKHITDVQNVFKNIFNLDKSFKEDGSQFDRLLDDESDFQVGQLNGKVLFVPGHTPACVAYQFGDAIFVGDTMFMPDVGTARCDFPGGNAKHLYSSIRKILSFPDSTRLFMCHDYPPNQRDVKFETTVREQRTKNIHAHDGISEAEFVSMRTARDKTLDMPALIFPAVQINIRAGEFPQKEENGTAYLKIPLNTM
jgi:glyoxylase-like metal-dependent hydrolase (beta-lactamase superfamily II)